MEIARYTLLVLHLIGMVGILVSLLASRKKLSAGVTHSALLAFVTGTALVGLRYGLNDQDPAKWANVDNVKITIKSLFVALILLLGFRYKKKDSVAPVILWTIAVLALANTAIAIWW